MLHDPSRHESLHPDATQGWDEDRARACIAGIVRDAEARHRPGFGWPMHPLDLDAGDDPQGTNPSLYFGTCGVLWALQYLQRVGAADLQRALVVDSDRLLQHTRAWLKDDAPRERASYLMGETPVLMLAHAQSGDDALADRLAVLIEGNLQHPARELMWGAPGTLLAALHLHRRTGQARFAELFRRTAAVLWSQLEWSEDFRCHFWTQQLYGQTATYMDAVHGFAGTALPLIQGRHLLADADGARWQDVIATAMANAATWEGEPGTAGARVNWTPWLLVDPERRQRWATQPRWLVQYCHGSPGFVINLADFPGPELDALLLAAGETTWDAGPLAKGSNLCHGTGGNGYAFLKLYGRTGDTRWLQRARAFAMHGIRQTEDHTAQHGRGRYALWTGDPGFAIYLWDCIRGEAAFPTLDVF